MKEDALWQDHLEGAEATASAAVPVPLEVHIAEEAVPSADSMQDPATVLPGG